MKNTLMLFTLLVGIIITACKPTGVQTHHGYPEFNWNKVHQFAFVPININDSLSPDQIRFLVENKAIVILFKGNENDEDYNDVMAAFSAVANELKSQNPAIKIMCYFNTVIAIPGSPITVEFRNHPEWALTDNTGNYFLIRNLETYDMTIPELRESWAAGCAEMTSFPNIDGIFADAVPKFGMKNHPDLKNSLLSSEIDALSQGEYELLKLTGEKIGEDKLLIFNGLRGDLEGWSDGGMQYLDQASGCLVEHFCAFTTRDKKTGNLKTEMVVNDIELIGKASEMGKIVLVKGWPGNWNVLSEGYSKLTDREKRSIAEEHLEFALAVFLIAMGKNCYFEYSFGYTGNDGIFEHYDLLDRQIGKPLGKAEKQGLVFTREFENCKVWVDLEREGARIEWED